MRRRGVVRRGAPTRAGAALALALIAPRAVFALPACPAPPFIDNFEPATQPGWTFEVARNNLPSPTWAVASDSFAKSPANAFTSDAQVPDLKDDRLIAPPQNLTAASHLTFYHRFNFEDGFDGGVLEVSRDGGATWVDVLEGGGSFVSGGYNGTIDTGFQSPIAGQAAWTGLSQFVNGMNIVDVNLGAYAGVGILVRWRLALDNGVLVPGVGWWVDNVRFTNLSCDNSQPEDVCVAPGLSMLWDATGDTSDQQAAHDVQKLSISQPYFANGDYKIAFHLKVADLATVPGDTSWPVNFCAPAFPNCTGDTAYSATNKFYAVRMVSPGADNPGTSPIFQVRKPQAAGTARTLVTADPSSDYNAADGTITIVANGTDIGLNPANAGTEQLKKFLTRVQVGSDASGGATPDNQPDELVGDGTFTTVTTNFCAPNEPPVPLLSGNPVSGYGPLAVDFDASGTTDPDAGDTIASYTFGFGDGTPEVTQAGPTISHTYNQVGTYTATLRATDSHGRQSLDFASVTVDVLNRTPVAMLSPSATSGDSPLTVSFDASGSSDPDSGIGDSIVSYTFDFGDGSGPQPPQASPTANYTYGTRGTYDATLSVTDSNGAASTPVIVQIVVTPGPPVAQLAVSPGAAAKGDPVTLDASFSSADDVAEYTFDPGDGSGPVSVLPPAASTSHVYHLSGSYPVSLSVRDTQDVVASTTATITISNTAPVADLTATPDPAEGQPPLTVSFDASGSFDPDAAKLPGEDFVESYEFDYGDGVIETVSVPAVNHTYTAPGNYTAYLAVYDREGKKSSNVAAWPGINVLDTPPVAVLGADQTSGFAPMTVVLDGAGSSDPDAGDSVVSYTFAFGDGSDPVTRVGGTTVQHTYANPGDYDATLVVQDSYGAASAPVTLTLHVGAVNRAPIARATADKVAGNAPLAVTFDASTSTDTDGDAIVEYTFDFGDGTTVTQAQPAATHSYTTAGRYAGSVTVRDARGALSSNSDAVTITANDAIGDNTTAPPIDDSKGPFSGALSHGALLALGLMSLMRRRRALKQTNKVRP